MERPAGVGSRGGDTASGPCRRASIARPPSIASVTVSDWMVTRVKRARRERVASCGDSVGHRSARARAREITAA